MIRILIPIALLVLGFILAGRYINAVPREQRGSRQFTVVLVALTLGLIILVMIHRMHWLGPLAPALVLAGRKLKEFFSGHSANKKNNPDDDKKY